MELSELTYYAKENYHMREEHKWADFPGFSVLNDPDTGKWVALLMRQWDYETGTELQRCDIKCGRQCLTELNVPYVTTPFRMKGENWVGVLFDDRTEAGVVFDLFDLAVKAVRKRGYTVALEPQTQTGGHSYTDTLLPLESLRGNYRRQANSKQPEYRGKEQPQTGIDPSKSHQSVIIQPRPQHYAAPKIGRPAVDIPLRIQEMMRLYEFRDSSFENKCRNFLRQGRFMEDYEDDATWSGEFRRYFTTYHDLNLNQLRGFFAWRSFVRRGEYRRITASLAYMYLYELLNEIGASSPEESLRKMKEFEKEYLDAGFGDAQMRENLHRWMMEFTVLKGFSLEKVLPYMDPAMIARDQNLLVLRKPEKYSDEEVFDALSALTDGKPEKSSAIVREPQRGKHLFAEVWRNLSEHYMDQGWDIFTACFGKLKQYPWYPLSNAVYMDEEKRGETVYALNECRKFIYKDGGWSQIKYDDLFFDNFRVHAVIHEADRQIRRYLKTGHYLRAKKGEEWITPYVEAVIEADQAAIEEAAKPKITIDLSGLDKIRRDAQITRDSLLTEEELREEPAAAEILRPAAAEIVREKPAAAEIVREESKNKSQTSVRNTPDCDIMKIPSLDEVHGRILLSVMRGESAADLIRDNHLMASVVTDAINEALFDEIGDNVLECSEEEITLVEDYREDLELMLGGDS